MIVIIEGCDGTGKTTLAKKIAKKFKLKYLHEAVPPKPGYEYYAEKALTLPDNCVVDRFHLGECVYPRIKKGKRYPLEVWQQHHIERILMARGAILIFCDAPAGFIKNIFKTRGENFIGIEDIDKIRHLFNLAFDNSLLIKREFVAPWYENFEHANIKAMMKFVSYNITLTKLQIKQFSIYEGIGRITSCPHVLVGDRYFDGSFIGGNLKAFCSPGNSSAYLNKALANVVFRNHIYLTNAVKTKNKQKNKKLLREELDKLNASRVVALGNVAKKMLDDINIPAVKVPHPQYWRRFHYKKVKQYANKIEEAISGQHK